MTETTLATSGSSAELGSLLGLAGIAPSLQNFGSATAPESDQDVSVAGVMLLSAVSVFMAILGMLTLAAFVIGCWWLISHIPVPPFVHHVLVRLHLAAM